MLGIAYLLIYLLCGCLIIRVLLPHKSVIVRIWLGCALGILLMMWLPALFAFAFSFSVKAHLLALIPLAVLTGGCFIFLRDRKPAAVFGKDDKSQLIIMACVVVPLILLGGYLQYTHCLREVNGALHVG